MKELKVAQEQAEQEFDQWAEDMDLDLDVSEMDAEDLTAFSKQKRKIVKAITLGSLTFSESGEAVYTPSNKKSKCQEPITFFERTGASMMAMDGKKKGHDIGKTFAVMGEMCKVHPSTFAGLVGIDGKICEALFSLLMD